MPRLGVMGFYSFAAFSRHTVTIADPLILIGEGANTFTALTDDVDGLVKLLESEGVEIQEVNKLDDHEPVPPAEGLLLPGDDLGDFQLLREGVSEE